MASLIDKECFRLGLILAGMPIDTVVKESGDYTKIFHAFLAASLKSLEGELSRTLPRLELVSYKAFGDDRQLPSRDNTDNIDGYMITGSASDAYANIPWINELVDFIGYTLNKPDAPKVVGVCFGHQVLARALDDKSVVCNPLGWEVGPTVFKLTEVGKRVFEFSKDDMSIQQMHRDHVISIPKGFANLGSTSISQVQGLYNKEKAISVQGHPEFTEDIVSKMCSRRLDLGIFTPKQYEEILSRIHNPHDGMKIGVTFWKFFFSMLPTTDGLN
ncbi:hypothetical protein DSO57_1012422 [Entomophthora muscae]|uniref:Uncharacterized protein n=1 Tax=Entomophthora muscae TaxID=34485 RepID=A0ACC2RKU0_9FUNG|nr:hypothetical protein DSO57_1012422 [Entomophthora muscae]